GIRDFHVTGVQTVLFRSSTEIALSKKHGDVADKLHTALHEVIGHASGKINPGIETPKQTLKNYASTIEEARADLVALYYILDPRSEERRVGKERRARWSQ